MPRKPYPTDVSDEEWSFAAPYLVLMTQDAPQREHSLREVFNALRWIVRAGSPWRLLPNDFPPWKAVMIGLPAHTRVWIAAGHTDMRKGFNGLAALVQTTLADNPHSGYVFVFRGRRGDLLKVLWFDGYGLLLLAKRLEKGRFIWPQATSGSVSLTSVLAPM